MQILPTETRNVGGNRSRDVRVGDHVRVRHQRWVVTDIRPHQDCSAVTLSGLGPSNLGVEQQVLTPFDVIEPLVTHRSLRIVRPRRWRRVCRQLIADAGPAAILRTALTARMDLMPHQLEPALAIIHGRGTRVLIADEVGLGKTVQAALIVAELKARGAVTRALILTPAGLRDQWVEEFSTRFDLPLALFDIASVARRKASLPVGVNPWAVEPFIVTSIDYFKRAEVRPAVEACRWDLVIVDEAHHAAVGTDRHDAVNTLCSVATYVVLLTATPHNGDATAFASLRALGEHQDGLLAFRRTRQQIGQPHTRRIHQLRVRPSATERTMHAALDAFVRAVQREPGGRDQATWLALSTLRKRALSSAYALDRSVERRLNALNTGVDVSAHQIPLPLFDAGGEFEAADDVPDWTIPALRDARHEQTLLSRVARAARSAVGHESKLAALRRLLRRIHEPVIVFTEYRDTLTHVLHQVATDATVLHGGLSRDQRRRAIECFRRGGVLLATDAAGEGLNLHQGCRIVVNLELPWNPMRLEQRIGRVDRIGQKCRVHAFHLIAAGTAETRVLARLGMRIARAQADIGAPNPLAAHDTVDQPPIATAGRMEVETAQEHERLVFARNLVPTGLTGEVSSYSLERHALVTFAKRKGIRLSLGSHVLVLNRSILANDAGQPLACHLTSLRFGCRNDFVWSLSRLESLKSVITADDGYKRWLESSLATHRAFWTTRLGRETAVADAHRAIACDELQPGLFDLRAVRLSFDEEEQRRETLRTQSWQAQTAARMAHAGDPTSQVALVLLTR